jgi:hypothetical protein
MQVNGLKAAFHMPQAVLPKFKRKNGDGYWHPKNGEDDKGEEVTQGLPPGSPRFVFPVDEYKGCPANWMHGSSKASSYWLPVRSGCGMWIDLNYNYNHSHHVACVVSIQGVNPITGQQTKKLRLEQYRERCPVHDIEFGQERFCEMCNYKWDAQNYVASNCTPKGLLWIDGFRFADGVVRQYVFTKETCKGVAANVIGDERVFAIGIAFYLSKKPKAEAPIAPELTKPDGNYDWSNSYGGSSAKYSGDIATFKRVSIPLERRAKAGGKILTGFPPSNTISPSVSISDKDHSFQMKSSGNSLQLEEQTVIEQCAVEDVKMDVLAQNPQLLGVASPPPPAAGFPTDDSTSLQQSASGDACTNFDADYSMDEDHWIPTKPVVDLAPGEKLSPSDISGELVEKSPEEIEREMEKLEITAGARIRQRIYVDPEEPDFWQEEPAGFIYINYVDLETAEKILSAGQTKMAGSFLAGVNV